MEGFLRAARRKNSPGCIRELGRSAGASRSVRPAVLGERRVATPNGERMLEAERLPQLDRWVVMECCGISSGARCVPETAWDGDVER